MDDSEIRREILTKTSHKFSDAAKAFDATMTPMPLDRAGQRRLARATRKDARRGVGSAEDSAFFKANPTRNHRMRLATANEIAVFDSAEGCQRLLVAGRRPAARAG